MLQIAVCMKQVPALNEGKMDEGMGTLIRKDIPPVVNVYDLTALEAALRLKEEHGGTVTVFSMGPESAESLLREAFAMGADRSVLVTGPEFAGADAVATAYALAQAIKVKGPFDLILCGRQTTDGDTAQVGGAIAQFLDIPSVYWVSRIHAATPEGCTVTALTAKGQASCRVDFPCLLTVERELAVPRIPGLRAKIAAKKRQPECLTLRELPDRDPAHYGRQGSGTRVIKIFSPREPEPAAAVSMGGKEAAACILGWLDEPAEGGIR